MFLDRREESASRRGAQDAEGRIIDIIFPDRVVYLVHIQQCVDRYCIGVGHIVYEDPGFDIRGNIDFFRVVATGVIVVIGHSLLCDSYERDVRQ